MKTINTRINPHNTWLVITGMILFLSVVLSIFMMNTSYAAVDPGDGAGSGDSGDSTLSPAAQQECMNKWNGKQINKDGPTEVPKAYKDSKCPESKGGICHQFSETETGKVYIICVKTTSGEGEGEGEGSEPGGGGPSAPSSCDDLEKNGLLNILPCTDKGGNIATGMLLTVMNFLAVGVGIAVVGGIIWGGAMYASSNGDSNKIQQAKMIIVNAVLGLLLFFFMYAIVNYLVPGNLFS